jgi:hypothetical protein
MLVNDCWKMQLLGVREVQCRVQWRRTRHLYNVPA